LDETTGEWHDATLTIRKDSGSYAECDECDDSHVAPLVAGPAVGYCDSESPISDQHIYPDKQPH
jgi:hypothetical protein